LVSNGATEVPKGSPVLSSRLRQRLLSLSEPTGHQASFFVVIIDDTEKAKLSGNTSHRRLEQQRDLL
jgi:hypothetical protein